MRGLATSNLETLGHLMGNISALDEAGTEFWLPRGIEAAAEGKGVAVITPSGFKPDNPLRHMGRVNYYVPALDYGPAEVLNHAVGHNILDGAMSKDRSE